MAQRFPHVTFIHGDGTSLRLMEEEQIGEADYFVSTTHDDECNIMTAVQSGKLGAKHVEAVINKSDYEEILNNLRDSLGIETIVSPRVVTANEVLRFISRNPYNELFKLPGQSARILEFVVREGSPACDLRLRDIAWPKFAVVVALQHKYTARVPGADDVIRALDRVAVVTREDNIKALQKLLRG
ncbi:MAG: NAD-binding protein [Verrucomicrobia bacterium]|nr:NAD-binding protein [Verrucomicrobiota bacterium]